MRRCDGSQVGRPQNGTQAHATSRELEFVRPARVGATPFWDRPSSEPASGQHSKIGSPFGGQKQMNKQQCHGVKVLPMS